MRRRLLALAALLLACATPAVAQQQKRAALVIGNAAYLHLPGMKDADQDAAAMAASLNRLGFTVATAINADLRTMRSAVAQFQRDAAGADAALLFYAGHALRYRNAAYIAPVDATLKDETSAEWDALQLRPALDALANARAAFVVIDGCGQDQLAPVLDKFGGDAAAGLGSPPERSNVLAALSTATGDPACITPARSSLLTRALLSEIEQPGLPAGEMFERARQIMSRRSGGRQNITFGGTATGGFVFALSDLPDAAFRRLGADPSAADLRSFTARYPDHPLADVAKTLLAGRERRPDARGGADAWRGQLSGEWRSERQGKTRMSRLAALDGRWNRETSDRAAEAAAAEERRQAQERAEREKAEREEKARLQRQQEDERRRQAELAAAEQRRQAQERAEREKAEREEKARAQRQQQEEERRRQAELAAEQKRQEQARADRDKAEKDERARLAREEDERRRQAEIDADARRAAEEQRLAAIAARQQQPQKQDAILGPVPVGGQAVDEVNRFIAEQRRLAQERIERDRRARGQPEEFTEPLLSETGGGQGAPGNQTIAALPPVDSKPPPVSVPKAGTPEFIKAAQEELKRLGCYSGVAQGRMSSQVKSALDSAAKKIGRSFQADPLTEDGLRTLKAQRSGLCGLAACGQGQVRRGDICVTPRGAGRNDGDSGRQAAPQPARQRQVAKPAAAAPAGGGGRGGCFNFGGRQYCQ